VISGSRAGVPVSGGEASPESARADHEAGSFSAGALQGEGSLSAEADQEVGSFSVGADHEDGSFSPGADCGGFSVSQVKSSARLSPAVSGVLGKAASNGPRAACAPTWLPLADVTCGSAGVSQPVLAPQPTPLSRLVSGSAGWS